MSVFKNGLARTYSLVLMLCYATRILSPFVERFDYPLWEPLVEGSCSSLLDELSASASNPVVTVSPPGLEEVCKLSQVRDSLPSNPLLSPPEPTKLHLTSLPSSTLADMLIMASRTSGSEIVHQEIHNILPGTSAEPPLSSTVHENASVIRPNFINHSFPEPGGFNRGDSILPSLPSSTLADMLIASRTSGSEIVHQEIQSILPGTSAVPPLSSTVHENASLICPNFINHSFPEPSGFNRGHLILPSLPSSTLADMLLTSETPGNAIGPQDIQNTLSHEIIQPFPFPVRDASFVDFRNHGFSNQRGFEPGHDKLGEKLSSNENDYVMSNDCPNSILSTTEGSMLPSGNEAKLRKKPQTNYSLPNGILANGRIVETLVKEYTKKFQERQGSAEYRMRSNGKKSIHPALPYMLVERPLSYSGQISRVCVSSPIKKRTLGKIYTTLYTLLIGWLYDLHQNDLNQLNITAGKQKLQQRKVLEWLENEISSPAVGLPVLGLVPCPIILGSSIDEFGPLQLILIKYFSADEYKKYELAPKTASCILEKFKLQNLDDYMCLNLPSKAMKESQIEHAEDPIFQKIMNFFLPMAPPAGLFSISSFNILQDWRSKDLVSKFSINFESKLGILQKNSTVQRSRHPSLPLAIYFANEDSKTKMLRLLVYGESTVVKIRDLRFCFARLIKISHSLHTTLLRKLRFTKQLTKLTEFCFLTWIIEEIFQPRGSLPVQGFIDFKVDCAPWDLPADYHNENHPSDFFGNVQLSLIKLFSEKDSTNQLLFETARFLIASWYQCEPPNFQSKYFKNIQEDVLHPYRSEIKRRLSIFL